MGQPPFEYDIMSTPHPAVQQLTNSSPLTPAISNRWFFCKKVLDSSLMESYDGHTNKAKEISMEKITNRNIQNNELEQEQFSLQDRIQNIHNFENEDTTRDQEIAIVASMIGRIPTLERQNLDSQDFHDISVWTLQEMLRVSYELGKLSQEAPVPTEL